MSAADPVVYAIQDHLQREEMNLNYCERRVGECERKLGHAQSQLDLAVQELARTREKIEQLKAALA